MLSLQHQKSNRYYLKMQSGNNKTKKHTWRIKLKAMQQCMVVLFNDVLLFKPLILKLTAMVSSRTMVATAKYLPIKKIKYSYLT